MQLPEPILFRVTDPDDDLAFLRFVQGLHAPGQGRIEMAITPYPDNLRSVAADIHEALGKDFDASGTGRTANELWSRSQLWLVVTEARDLFVNHVEQLGPTQLTELIKLAVGAGVRLWLIDQATTTTPARQRVLDRWPIIKLTTGDFRAHWSNAKPDNPPTGAIHAPLPLVPLDDFLTFRAACHDILEPDQFKQVDAVFCQARARAQAWIADVNPVTDDAIAALLRDLLEDAQCYSELLTRLRATQGVMLLAGWLMRVDPDLLAATEESRVTFEPWVVAAIARYAAPRHAAAGALAVGTRLSPDSVTALNLGDCDPERGVLQTARGTITLDQPGRPLLAALYYDRRLSGADDTDPLFAYSPGTGTRGETLERWTGRGLNDRLKVMERETGVLLASHWQRRVRENDRASNRRRGVKLERLT